MTHVHHPDLIACHECDLLHELEPVAEGQSARCLRCGATLYRERKQSLERTLALSVGALILFVIANVFPMLSLQIAGRLHETHLISGVIALVDLGMIELALAVLMTNIVFPFLLIMTMIALLLPGHLGFRPWQGPRLFRLVVGLKPWAMMEVFSLGVLVAVVKLADMAEVIFGPALWAFSAMIVLNSAAAVSFEATAFWRQWDHLKGQADD